MRSVFLYLYILLLGVSFSAKEARATHLRAGEIVVLRDDCTSLTFTITITVFTDTGSEVRFGEGVLNFGDGATINTPTINNRIRNDLGPEVGLVVYQQKHTYAGPGRYIISYREPNRNADILNMFGSVETQFYLETVINIDPILGCNNTPQLLIPPIDGACMGAAWMHNPGAYDLDGDSLSFELITPKQNTGQFVIDYLPPNDRKFYQTIGLNYDASNEAKNAPPVFDIDVKTGTITWDAPGAPGEYNIAFLIKEWRKIGDAWVLLGYVTRDMQVIVDDCNNDRPQLAIPKDICVEAGTVITEDIVGTDPDYDNVKIEAYSLVFQLPSSPATYAPRPPVFQSTRTGRGAKQTFTWATQCEHVKEQPYQIVFKITDRPSAGVSLVSFETWNITVVAPAPTWDQIEFGTVPQTANLKWNPYTCANAENIQIWRKEGPFDAVPSDCEVGMPAAWGFTKIAEVSADKTSFMDDNEGRGLVPGLTYCYRIVAEFPAPVGGESYVSEEQCLTARADVPIPTKVTVDITNLTNGQITVAWRLPFEADTLQFPPPYTFELYRAEGFMGNAQETKTHLGRVSDSIFVDSSLNTQEKVYNYRIVAFDSNGTEMGSSVAASSVQLSLNAQFEQIGLKWAANVPWSNTAQRYPWHYVYRGPADATEDQMVLIDSIDVTKNSFNYVDAGQFNNTPLSTNQKYCYRIMTKGTYDNSKIEEPLLNFSQISCAQPNDQKPPCKPTFSIELNPTPPCDEYIASTPCNPSTFSNLLKWDPPVDPACREDVESYNIYVAQQKGGAFMLYKEEHKGTEFNDENLPSFARCYKISALDQAKNESELSEPVCFDNCPNYELPNVFTPNGDLCNQTFSAYSGRIVLDEGGNAPCGSVDEQQIQMRCARFVEKVNFTLFNRWGKPVYDYQSGGEKSIFIDWEGRDNFGKELSEGIYFFLAEVVFNVVDPAKKHKVIKGWVHLIR